MNQLGSIHSQTALENDIREVLCRLLKLESALANHTLRTTAYLAAQDSHWNILNQVTVQVQELQLEQRAQFMSMKAELDTTRSPLFAAPSVIAMTPVSKEPSPENACGFPHCKYQLTTKRPCSALQSLRHMRECTHCPLGQCRFLSIAQHMLAFRAPRVTHPDICCWCGCLFKDLWKGEECDNPDIRTRHRKSCLLATISKLQSEDTHDSAVILLDAIWSADNELPVSPIKRGRLESPTIASANLPAAPFPSLNSRTSSPFLSESDYFSELCPLAQ